MGPKEARGSQKSKPNQYEWSRGDHFKSGPDQDYSPRARNLNWLNSVC